MTAIILNSLESQKSAAEMFYNNPNICPNENFRLAMGGVIDYLNDAIESLKTDEPFYEPSGEKLTGKQLGLK